MLNRRFIRAYMAELSWNNRGVNLKTYGSQSDEIRDLIKALCFITGRSYDEVAQPEKPSGDGIFWPGEWYDWGFFRFKAFKKGTVHFEFQDEEVWAAVNARYARIKGQVLPENLAKPKPRRKAKSEEPIGRPVRMVSTGRKYPSLHAAAAHHAVSHQAIRRALRTGGTCAGSQWRDA
jgi:hypothetical protein